jgi:hypothetical protein
MATSISGLKPFVVLLGIAICAAPAMSDQTPETRTMTADEANLVLERDWLFQAMGEPLLPRAAQEIGWARQLAERLALGRPAPDLSAELQQLDALEQRLDKLSGQPPYVRRDEGTEAAPVWIWFPDGKPAADAPAEARFFRRRFELPAKAGTAELRVAADDACEVFVNGTRVGSHETWQRAAVFPSATC